MENALTLKEDINFTKNSNFDLNCFITLYDFTEKRIQISVRKKKRCEASLQSLITTKTDVWKMSPDLMTGQVGKKQS